MSSIPTKRAFLKWDNSNLADDFLQLQTASGKVLGWIDSSGSPQGALAIGGSGGVATVHTDSTLSGTGSVSSPLSVVAPVFSAIASGTSTSALIIGTGGSISAIGTGTITATNGVTPFLGVPTGSCTQSQLAVDTTTGNFYSCVGGAWLKVGPGAAGALTSPIVTPNPLAFDVNLAFKGPNPYVDVTRYGVRAVAVNSAPVLAGITATISSGTNIATLSSASTFVNGDGVVIYGAGATNTMSTPAVPTVTPSLAAGATNTNVDVASPSGSATYNYQIVLRDKAGALTAASSVGSSATGQATLGMIQVNVISLTRTNNSVAVVTASGINVAVGATIYLTSSTDASFSGVYKVATVTNSTNFTYLQTVDTREGATLSAMGGTVQMYVCNKLTMPAYPANGWQYYIYGRTGGSLTLIGVTKPLDTVFEDYGSPFMDGVTLPSYVPNTPPGAATNDYLVTTIVSGAGTTTLTLANNAINSVAGATIKFDNAPGFAAAAAAAGNGVPLYIPTSTLSYPINSYLALGANITIWQAGSLNLFETLELGSWMLWRGDIGGNSAGNPTFALSQQRSVTIQTANPGIFFTAGGSTRVVGVYFGVSKQGTGIIMDDLLGTNTGFGQTFEHCYFNVNTSGDGLDYMGIGVIIRGDSFNFFSDCTFSVSDVLARGSSLTPILLLREGLEGISPSSLAFISDSVFQNRAIVSDVSPGVFANMGIYMRNIYVSGLHAPLFTFTTGAGVQGGVLRINGVEVDTTSMGLVVNLTASTGVAVDVFPYTTISVEGAGGVPPMVQGNPLPSLTIHPNLGTGKYANFSDGNGYFSNNFVTVDSTGSIGFAMAAPSLPSLALSSGGNISAGTYTYKLTALDANGNESALGLLATVTVPGTCPGSGNCTVTITPPAAPTGSMLYKAYRSNGGGYGQVHVAATAWTSNIVDTFGFVDAGPPTPVALSSGFTSTGMETFKVTMPGTLFANIATPANGTFLYCSDCTITNPCAGGGSGALAKRLNGIWICN
jgi:hypothetical protein